MRGTKPDVDERWCRRRSVATPRARRLIGLSACAWVLGATVPWAQAAVAGATVTYTVTSTSDAHDPTPADSTCDSTLPGAACSLRAAIETVDAHGGPNAIAFSVDGTFSLTLGQLRVTGTPTQTLTVSGNGRTKTVIDAGQLSRLFQIDQGATVSISGVTAQHGKLVGGNGGGFVVNGTLRLSKSLVRDNTVDASDTSAGQAFGGGFFVSKGKLTVTNSTITANTVKGGTGTSGSSGGGGIEASRGVVKVSRSTISSNTVSSGGFAIGGGIDAFSTKVTITSSTLNSNGAATGGGLFANGGVTATITNSTFSGNFAGGAGGAIFIENDGAVTVASSTVASNTAGLGSGLFFNPGGSASLVDTIVANNPSTNCGNAVDTQGHNIDSGTSCGFDVSMGDQISTNPMLGPLHDNGGPTKTHSLLAGSPAIDTGDDASCPNTDQRGVVRVTATDTICDIGAYEFP